MMRFIFLAWFFGITNTLPAKQSSFAPAEREEGACRVVGGARWARDLNSVPGMDVRIGRVLDQLSTVRLPMA
ncbi:MAG: hypothetical protein JWR15_3157 [Prosthecobacter sp.]|nr:hypothetical protein [Prosthecobacter sp.]